MFNQHKVAPFLLNKRLFLSFDLCCRQYSARGSSARREPTFLFTVKSQKPFLAFQVPSVDSSSQISSSCVSLVLTEILCQILISNATQKHKIFHVNRLNEQRSHNVVYFIDRSIDRSIDRLSVENILHMSTRKRSATIAHVH